LFPLGLSLKTPSSKVDNIFTRHSSYQMEIIVDTLYKYACDKNKDATYDGDKGMFNDIAHNLWNVKGYIEKRQDKAVYLGWTPLCATPDKILKTFTISRNDNADDVTFNKIPLYFIVLEPKNNTIYVEKIVHNPSIDIDINPYFIKEHLSELSKEANTSLDLTHLKFYDSGRWYLSFNHNFQTNA
tara:strand:+ start:3010 stop:3564 length:555 start_codon:yes stop_codon:yes gene_type:complete